MNYPMLFTVTSKIGRDVSDIPMVSVHLSTESVMEELNTLVKENDDFFVIFHDAFSNYCPNVTEEDIKEALNPLKSYIAAMYESLESKENPVEFEEDQFQIGMLFKSTDGNTFIDISSFRPCFDVNKKEMSYIYQGA